MFDVFLYSTSIANNCHFLLQDLRHRHHEDSPPTGSLMLPLFEDTIQILYRKLTMLFKNTFAIYCCRVLCVKYFESVTEYSVNLLPEMCMQVNYIVDICWFVREAFPCQPYNWIKLWIYMNATIALRQCFIWKLLLFFPTLTFTKGFHHEGHGFTILVHGLLVQFIYFGMFIGSHLHILKLETIFKLYKLIKAWPYALKHIWIT